MPEDPQQSKYSSVPSGDSVKMPEDPHPQQTNFSFSTDRDSLDGFVFSHQRRMEGLERFKKKRKLRAIPECSCEDMWQDEEVQPSSESAPVGSVSAPVTAAATDSLIVDEMDEDEDDYEMAYPCPYCYAEFEFLSLCHHLEDEHYDETAETACSICADTITGEDMLHHITTEHEPLLKMALQQNRLQKLPELGSQDLSLLTRDLRDTHLSTHLAGKGHQSSSGMTDPLLSSLVLNYPAPGAEEISKLVTSCAEESTSQTEPAQHIWQSSFDPSLSSEEREKRTRQAAGKAAFVQDLVCSTMFLD